MKNISPFEFLNKFEAQKKVVFVGNAPEILNYEHGNLIDSYDYVIRFNECTISAYQKQLGKKTSILVVNPYAEKRIGTALEGGSAECVVCIFQQTRRADFAAFEKWLGTNQDVMFTYCPDLVGVEDTRHKASFTTGTYGVQLLSRILAPSEVLITGFSMFAQSDQSHYWTTGVSEGTKSHDFNTEAGVFIRLLNSSKCPVKITQEVAKVATRTNQKLARHINLI